MPICSSVKFPCAVSHLFLSDLQHSSRALRALFAASQLEAWCTSHFPDTTSSGPGFKFDVVLAGDVLYKEGLPFLFFASVNR